MATEYAQSTSIERPYGWVVAFASMAMMAVGSGATYLVVVALNQPGVLGTISTVIGKQSANITDVRFGHRAPDLYEIFLDVEVDGLEHLQRVQAALRASSVVSSVERVLA